MADKDHLRFKQLALAVSENLWMAGTIFGWAAISRSMLRNTENGNPGFSDDKIASAFVYAASVNLFSPLPLGVILDKFGPRFTNCLCVGVIAVGSALVALSADTGALFIPGMALVGLGGVGVQMSCINLTESFPVSIRGTVTSVIVGAGAVSYLVFLLMQGLSTAGFQFATIFWGYALLCAAHAVFAFFLFPIKPIKILGAAGDTGDLYAPLIRASGSTDEQSAVILEDPEEFNSCENIVRRSPGGQHKTPAGLSVNLEAVGDYPHKTPAGLSVNLETVGDYPGRGSIFALAIEERRQTLAAPLKVQGSSREFLFFTVFSCFALFWMNFTNGTLPLLLADTRVVPFGEEEHYGSVLTITMGAGLFFSPLSGYILDRRWARPLSNGGPSGSHCAADASDVEEAAGLRGLLLLAVGCGVAFSLALAIMTSHAVSCGAGGDGSLGDPGCPATYPPWFIVALPFYAAFQNATLLFTFELPARRFGHISFGMLTGGAYATAGLVSLLQIPILDTARGDSCPENDDEGGCGPGNWEVVMWTQSLFFVVLFSYPLWLWWRDEGRFRPIRWLKFA